uniref:Uncharacterized protein n=1 Tax=Romanomermis culicivorax TaxID=13658 RepID=A0A915KW55_ROMCU
MTLRSKKVA